MMESGGIIKAETATAVMELRFSPKELVRSRYLRSDGEVFETGVKGAEVRWQQGAIAVCILLVYTRLWQEFGLEGDGAVLEGERGSPARSLDNLLNKPGDWTVQMFGESRMGPSIRELVYRKKTVSRNNPVSAVQWNDSLVSPEQIRIWREGEEVEGAAGLESLLRTLLAEFNPRRVEKEWEAMFPVQPEPKSLFQPEGAELEDIVENPVRVKPGWKLPLVGLLALASGLAIGRWWSSGPAEVPAAGSVLVVERFIDSLNSDDVDGAYAMLSRRFQEEMTPEAFEVAFGEQRFNFPRIAGNPYGNTADATTHEFRVTLYVESRVHRIPELENIGRIPLGDLELYADRVSALVAKLTGLGVEPGVVNQLDKLRLERPDASRHIQVICGLSDGEIERIFPEEIATTLDMTLFFEVMRNTAGEWRINDLEDASERLVAF